MADYVYPSVFFSYFLFVIFLVGAIYFFARSFRDGYWDSNAEDAKYRMLSDDRDSVSLEAGRGRH
jgi:hypothetical protein